MWQDRTHLPYLMCAWQGGCATARPRGTPATACHCTASARTDDCLVRDCVIVESKERERLVEGNTTGVMSMSMSIACSRKT